MTKNETGRFWALLPLIIFLVVYLVTSLVLNDFYKMPILVAFLFSAIVGFLQYPKLSFSHKTEEFSKGAGDPGIMLMILIFLLAGAFAELSKAIGAVQSTINFALSYLSPNLLIAGLFLTACFISLSLGTSVGTVVALAPIAVGLHETISGNLAVYLAAVVGGAMFGDNLSMISDTTIAATRTQGVEMLDKFKVNFLIVLPAAILTFLLYVFSSDATQTMNNATYDYSIIKVLPYVFIFVAALLGLNVIWVLILGIVLTLFIGLYFNLEFWPALGALNSGMASMFELSIICILIGGIVGLIRYYGGIDFILHHVSRKVKSARGGELGIFSLTTLVNIALANNTITILIVGPLAKTISDKNNIDPRRSASVLDTTSCFVQGALPYGAQLLAAVAIANNQVTAVGIMRYLYYPYLIGISTLLFILFRKQKSTSNHSLSK
ncbi:MAG: Na+/H+ antiporter NhaC family protein [Cytophagales bacterium]|jgi:Na+/H+ antiporter NhaC|nr:Na+/H+ antiporter NhaC family protein [Cytophagales bacterium]MCA6367781.1 Na+/H+ antiporter NhaC family protein [Cytophagales bacterium]MCA6369936.1 Na+/H+ antiporter NhaC family protein [Cytophagales bacterium]MCA6375094.1 Na+/H+ antiporter NhaC family protein [Cytophagales bacterium]MCA6382595.1 Na+/H+ antiporter NhaC family protein [Cytophagales bacterium]